MVHPKPFLTLHLDTSKDIATERGDALSGTQLYHRANFQADWHHHRRHICLTTKNGLTADDKIIRQIAYWRCDCHIKIVIFDQ